MTCFVMLDHEQSAAACSSLDEARKAARITRDAEPTQITRTVSIYLQPDQASEDAEWIEDVPLFPSRRQSTK